LIWIFGDLGFDLAIKIWDLTFIDLGFIHWDLIWDLPTSDFYGFVTAKIIEIG